MFLVIYNYYFVSRHDLKINHACKKACAVVYLGFRGQISTSASELSKLVRKSFSKGEMLLSVLKFKLWKIRFLLLNVLCNTMFMKCSAYFNHLDHIKINTINRMCSQLFWE